ncbi:hypothetical protein A1D29_05680 [Pasteurellaceae bacterium Orientalotternb1]|nr:hypothetical protein A1D29_05680 [Pasteurellaceae bacterium Orientalotternb1]
MNSFIRWGMYYFLVFFMTSFVIYLVMCLFSIIYGIFIGLNFKESFLLAVRLKDLFTVFGLSILGAVIMPFLHRR